MAADHMCIVVDIQVNLTFWQACKLRLAGATYVQGYVEHLIAMQLRMQDADLDDDNEEENDAPARW